MTTATYDPRTGSLTATPEALTTLTADGTKELTRAGAWEHGGPHRGLTAALDAVRDPVGGTLRLTYKRRSLDGWVGPARTALLTPPDDDGRRTLLRMHPTLVPGALAKAVALQPRPPAAGPRGVEELAGEPGIVRWWTFTHSTTAHRDGALLEVVDTDSGLYLVTGDTAVPTAPSQVFRLLVRVVVGEPSATPPLRPVPTDEALPAAWT